MLVSFTHADEAWAQKVLECDCALTFIVRLTLAFSGHNRGTRILVKDGDEVEENHESQPNVKGKERLRQELDKEDLSAEELSGPEDSAGQDLDRLCLALGLLTNLVQVVDGAKDVLREIRTFPSIGSHLPLTRILTPH